MILVVIPAYNRKDKLEEALYSLTQQTNKKFMTVIVDDCSQENLGEVYMDFEDKLDIYYIRLEENKGPGHARQVALDLAIKNNIELITFLDSDDLLFPNAIEVMSHEMNHGRYDAIKTNISVEHTNEPQTTIKAVDSDTWIHGSMYRVSFLKNNNIRFPEIRTNEDLAFNNKVKGCSEMIGYIDTAVCLWRDEKHSITRDTQIKNHSVHGTDYIRAVYDIYDFFRGRKDKVKNLMACIVCCYNYYQMAARLEKAIPEEIVNKVREMYSDPLVNECFEDKKHMTRISHNIWPYVCIDKTMIYFDETFISWARRYGAKI